MTNRTMVLLALAALFFAGALLVMRSITNREIAKIPLEQRERMTDFDWLGVEESLPFVAPLGLVAVLLGAVGVGSAFIDFRAETKRRS